MKTQKATKKLEKRLASCKTEQDVAKEIADECATESVRQIWKILDGDILGRHLIHCWDMGTEEDVPWQGAIQKFENCNYEIIYWPSSGNKIDDGETWFVRATQLAADFLLGDLKVI